jgi:hypothetical protein
MRKYSLLYITLGLTALLGAFHFIAIELYFYWTLWWFDNVMHFLGGYSLGFLFLYLYFDSGIINEKASFAKVFFIGFISVMVLGGVWEVFEYYNDISVLTEKFDTLHDLIADAIGAISALWLTRQYLKLS